MRKAGWILPRALRMTIGALRAELCSVYVAMAGGARGFKAGEWRVQVMPFEDGAILRVDEFFRVALGAFQPGVLTFEPPSSLRVIEFFFAHRPTHDAIIQSVVFGVAPPAIVVAQSGFRLGRVIAAFLRQAPGDLLVAVETLELGRAATERVAHCALKRAIQIVMRLAERTRRDLPKCCRTKQSYQANEQHSHAAPQEWQTSSVWGLSRVGAQWTHSARPTFWQSRSQPGAVDSSS